MSAHVPMLREIDSDQRLAIRGHGASRNIIYYISLCSMFEHYIILGITGVGTKGQWHDMI